MADSSWGLDWLGELGSSPSTFSRRGVLLAFLFVGPGSPSSDARPVRAVADQRAAVSAFADYAWLNVLLPRAEHSTVADFSAYLTIRKLPHRVSGLGELSGRPRRIP